jgi:hypothetical protein
MSIFQCLRALGAEPNWLENHLFGFVENLRKRRIALAGCRDQAAIANNDAIMMRCDPMSLAKIDATCPLRIIAKIS